LKDESGTIDLTCGRRLENLTQGDGMRQLYTKAIQRMTSPRRRAGIADLQWLKNGGGTPKNGVGTPTATGPISTEVGVALNVGVPWKALALTGKTRRETEITIVKKVFICMELTSHENTLKAEALLVLAINQPLLPAEYSQ
jgi:hypothetical protein